MNKLKHLSCKNCNCLQKMRFKNNVIFCFGLVKKTYKPEDYYRICIQKNKKRNVTEIMLEEMYTMLLGLSSLLFEKRLTEVNNEQKKKI